MAKESLERRLAKMRDGGSSSTKQPSGGMFGAAPTIQKTFITNGPDADVTVVYAKLDEGTTPGSSRDRSSAGIEKRDRKVLTVVLDRGMAGFVQSQPLRKMGIHSSRTGELFSDNVRLGRDQAGDMEVARRTCATCCFGSSRRHSGPGLLSDQPRCARAL
jgi:alkylation response protein AidB-like acyl-CoA dehydrogenase